MVQNKAVTIQRVKTCFKMRVRLRKKHDVVVVVENHDVVVDVDLDVVDVDLDVVDDVDLELDTADRGDADAEFDNADDDDATWYRGIIVSLLR